MRPIALALACLLAAGALACVPDALPDPCARCPDRCGDGACLPEALATLSGPVEDLDVAGGTVFACATVSAAGELVEVGREGEVTSRGTVLGCGDVHVDEAVGAVYVNDAETRIARAGLDEGALFPIVEGSGLRSFDACGDRLVYVDGLALSVLETPAAGGEVVVVDPPLGPAPGMVRCSTEGRVAFTLPELESVMTWFPGEPEPQVVFNASRGQGAAPSLDAIAFLGEQLLVARGDELLLVEPARAEQPFVLFEGLVGPVRMRVAGRWVALADAGAGTVLAFDTITQRADVVASGLVEPRVSIDDEAIYFGDATGAIARVALPPR